MARTRPKIKNSVELSFDILCIPRDSDEHVKQLRNLETHQKPFHHPFSNLFPDIINSFASGTSIPYCCSVLLEKFGVTVENLVRVRGGEVQGC